MPPSRGKDDQISARDPGPARPWQMDETLAVLDDVEEERVVRLEPEGPGSREVAPAEDLSAEAKEAQRVGEDVEGKRVGRSGPTGSRGRGAQARSACQHPDCPCHPATAGQVSDLGARDASRSRPRCVAADAVAKAPGPPGTCHRDDGASDSLLHKKCNDSRKSCARLLGNRSDCANR